ncbi:SDR family NAD(P)-dependent oxidoreductase, partial [Streptomyces sp. TRM 70361]|uniref:SDR family NAD(P)-dependent oxidoreductase n=1 Tax=Streptomyces sp. TRM 70361 TaxID=3116553 RepID=UPI002E7BD216
TPAYWVGQVREPVRFADALASLTGVRTALELGPDGVLSAAASALLDQAMAVPALRPRRDETETLLRAVGTLHVRGVTVDWAPLLAPADGRRIELPTYAFARERYWPSASASARPGDVVSAGLGETGHPVLAAGVELADEGGLLLTGRISLRTHPWLAEHRVHGRIVVPGTVFVDLAVRAGDQTDCDVVDELVLHTPLVLTAEESVQLQVTVGAPGEDGGREITVHSRTSDGTGWFGQPWTRHASGTLRAAAPVAAPELTWPPVDAQAVPIDELYPELAAAGLDYGPVFQGLRGVWRAGEELWAEVELPETAHADAGRFGLHPALLDAALHSLTVGAVASDGPAGPPGLPFSWSQIALTVSGATTLRVRVSPRGADGVELLAVDPGGQTVVSVGRVVLRPLAEDAVTGTALSRPVHRVDWIPLPDAARTPDTWAVLGNDPYGAADALSALGADCARASDIATASADLLLVTSAPDDGRDDAEARVTAMLATAQDFLAREDADATLVVLTRGAVAASAGDDLSDVAGAAVRGLLRSVQSENPGRLLLVDVDADPWTALLSVPGMDEPELAVRNGRLYAARLTSLAERTLQAPEGPWRVGVVSRGAVEGVGLVSAPDAEAALEEGQVRVAVRAAGMNFRDVLNALGMYPGEVELGGEAAGVVVETGPGVSKLAVGDRVLGFFSGAMGPLAVADERLVAPVPAGWSFAQGAAVPIAFVTAYYGLLDVGGLVAGESVLVHAAAGGVGMAAVQIARHVGAEVYGTASPGKWGATGLDAGHLASSRDLEFEKTFAERTGGRGVDVVLNALAGEFVDASVRLLTEGGRFVEMGKADIRDPDSVEGRTYRAFDLSEAGPERIGQMLDEVLALFARGVLTLPPVRTFDVRRAPDAFRFMSQARHVGKVVLSVPRAVEPGGTVLITGGTGALGALIARYLVDRREVDRLLLLSRRGPDAEGADTLAADLEAAGARVEIVACDVTDPEALAEVLNGRRISSVFHLAGVLDDGVATALTPDRVAPVLAPKITAARALHQLVPDAEEFVLFSSVSATLGSPGQASYAAANAYLDALAHHRHTCGLPALSLAWGPWDVGAGMLGVLTDGDRRRATRSGLPVLTADEGLVLLDEALTGPDPAVVPGAVDVTGFAGRPDVPHLLRGLVRGRRRTAAVAREAGFADRLRALPPAERAQVLLDWVRSEAATVLGFAGADAVERDRAFKDLGFDSLTAVELRNRLGAATGTRLPATLVFDYPTPDALAERLEADLVPPARDPAEAMMAELDHLEATSSELSDSDRSRLRVRMSALLARWADAPDDRNTADEVRDADLHSATEEDIFALIDNELESP